MGEHFIRMGAMWWVFRVLFWGNVALMVFCIYRALSGLSPPLDAFVVGMCAVLDINLAANYFRVEIARRARTRAAFKALRDVEAQS